MTLDCPVGVELRAQPKLHQTCVDILFSPLTSQLKPLPVFAGYSPRAPKPEVLLLLQQIHDWLDPGSRQKMRGPDPVETPPLDQGQRQPQKPQSRKDGEGYD